jgi:predicted Fe-Mo cluster-binding NifX family protein
MLLAVPTYHDRVAPAFDFCHRVSFWHLDGKGFKKVAERKCRAVGTEEKAAALQARGTDVLLCGAISIALDTDLRARGIEVRSGHAGKVLEVVAAFACGTLDDPRFQLPGATTKQPAQEVNHGNPKH